MAIIVVTDSPHAGPTTGGLVSAPVFKRIAEATLQYLGVPHNVDQSVRPPVLAARSGQPARLTAIPAPSTPVVNFVSNEAPGTVPDLHGMSAREAVQKLARVGMTARLTGDGFVTTQDPAAGSAIESDSLCRLTLERAPARVLAVALHQ